ncbi:MAG: CRISPR-associated endonuclease Cas1 [Acidobacteriia bacterium]|nr:CRISPR-associated endonuclease Cas1 [Terriglobia bacterium]
MPLPFGGDQLWSAWERVQENEGCAGVDGVTVRHFAEHVHRRLGELRERVDACLYRPLPLLKILVEKGAGSRETRTLLVPAVRDRVLQTAVARHLSRSFEEEFLECSYGYRPGRSVDRAIARIRKCRELGYVFVADADIQSFFDRVDHDLLLHRLGERHPGETIMGLLRLWVSGAIWDGHQVRPLHRGIPQGSPISPLLANFFLEDFDRELEKSGRKLVRYADDFLILARTREDATQALLQSGHLLEQTHLDLNLEKTQITDFQHGFRFLGALFQGNTIWVPWKNERRQGHLLFVAPAMPLALRTRYELAPPRTTLEMAFEKAAASTAGAPPHESRSEPVAYLYLTEQGAILRKAGDRLLVEKDDEVLLDLPYHKLEAVLLFGNIQVTTQALGELLEKGVGLGLFSRQGMYRGSLAPARGHNIQLRVAQFRKYEDSAAALALARSIVTAKIANGRAVLARYRSRNDVSPVFEARIKSLENALAASATAENIAALDGVEGAAAHEYFSALMEFNRSEMPWPGRKKHPATDPLNALLSLTYTLVMHEFTALLEGVGLDPYLGFLHQVDYGRPSLALDLMEPFRHPVADRFVLGLVNRGMINAEHFRPAGDRPGVFLSPGPMKKYFAEYERWMLERPAVQDGATPPRFRDLLKTEVERLAAALRDNHPFEPYRFDDKKEEPPCNTSSVTI